MIPVYSRFNLYNFIQRQKNITDYKSYAQSFFRPVQRKTRFLAVFGVDSWLRFYSPQPASSSSYLQHLFESRQQFNIEIFPFCTFSSLIYLFPAFLLHSSESLEAMDGHKSRVFSACFNPRSAHELISGGWDNTIQFWDTRQPYALRRISGVHMCGDGLDISRNGREVRIFISRIQNPTTSTLTRSYSHGKYIKIVGQFVF